MRIALDYDDTFTRDPTFWQSFVKLARDLGHEVRIVTARDRTHDNIDDRTGDIAVIYCNGVAKRFFCHHFEHWDPDIWIDDKPEAVGNNSSFTKPMLAEWRETRDH
ncbi:hypothetical protein QN224_13115 [Sinorhizobium sp. 8-89]|uniref:hypothetical protein n=1 Tax=Sinorhizobium sp. 7-81 TaxID=3049087 RepID=UPI0024C3CC66|nr:hypothetical protein [Sinorhizobium sp. 7-81]MDK1386349.1 hypothetical protein [Sinorhizobium sp. 7-81]